MTDAAPSPAAARPAEGTLLRFRLRRADIAFVRYVLEASDGVATMSAVRGRDEVTWWVPPGREARARALAEDLAAEVAIRLLP